MPTLGERIKNGWNAFLKNKDPAGLYEPEGVANYTRPDRTRLTRGNDRTIITAVYNRIAIDASSIKYMHAECDENGSYVATIDSALNDILNYEANIDQTGRAFLLDIILSMFDEGCVAVVPIDTDTDPRNTGSYNILSARVGKITAWYPDAVRIRVYNDRTGMYEELIMPKRKVAIVENPFYAIMNEPNSIAKRLMHKLVLLDIADNNNSSGKMDLIIQLPYVVKSETAKERAASRRKDIEDQLANSKYGIAYVDGAEHITQLNRAVENNLLNQVEYLSKQLYSQFGLTEEIMNGTAKEEVMLNYYDRTVEPIAAAITDEFNRKFLTKNAKTRNHKVMFLRNPFKLVPVNSIADIADKFTRNEILTANEIRGIIGFRPSDDPRANELLNKNINHATDSMQQYPVEGQTEEGDEAQPNQMSQADYEKAMAQLEDFDAQLDALEKEVQG